MERGDVGFVLGLGGCLLGGVALFIALDAKKETQTRWTDVQGMVKSDDEHLAAMGEKLRAIESTQKDLQRRVNSMDAPRGGGDRWMALELRIDALEKGRGAADGASPSGAAPKEAKAAAAGEFDELLQKMTSGAATADDRERFWELAREKPALLSDLIKQFEKAVADAPRDKEAHRNLAQAYFVKLMSVPDGMEKGIWSNKMIGQEKAILDIDPEDWDARFSIGINYSFWPEQFNKRPDAIKEFETLRKVQEAQTPDKKHAQTYFQLRQLYLKDGRTDDAKNVLEEGLRRFPDDEELKKAKDGAK